MIKNINICRYFCFKNREEAKHLVESLNLKIQDLIGAVAKIDILPIEVNVALDPNIYELQTHDTRKNDVHGEKSGYVVKADFEIHFYAIHKSSDHEQGLIETEVAIQRLQELQNRHKYYLGKNVATLFSLKKFEKCNNSESISIVGKTKRDIHLELKDKIFESMKKDVDFGKSPSFSFRFDIYSFLRNENEGENGYTLTGHFQKSHSSAKEVEYGFDIE